MANRALEPDTPRVRGREDVLDLLRSHGWNATSFQVLEQGFEYWFDGDACVAYVATRGAWVAAGAPIAAEARLAEVSRNFAAAARAAGKRACFFGTEERFSALVNLPRLCMGEQPVWDPALWEETVRGARSLREQLRRARAKGVVVREAAAAEVAPGAPLRERVSVLAAQWLASRRMAPMRFLVGVELFAYADARRYFVAEREGELVALLTAVPIYARGGVLLEDLLRGPRAPNGTADLLVDAAMRACAAARGRYVTMGLAPLSGEVHGLLRTLRASGSVLYDFDGVRAFKARLRPQRWDRVYLSHPAGEAVSSVTAVLRAFAGGGLLRFGLTTVLRGPPVVVRLFAAVLVPWTAAIALADTARWFPAPSVQALWVAFDAALCLSLFALSRRWSDKLALVLAALITVDAAVTTAEALAFNLPRLLSPGSTALDVIAVGAAVLAPSCASAVLWGSLRTRRDLASHVEAR
jgi:phosphatidylglycerol lysyltransferase